MEKIDVKQETKDELPSTDISNSPTATDAKKEIDLVLLRYKLIARFPNISELGGINKFRFPALIHMIDQEISCALNADTLLIRQVAGHLINMYLCLEHKIFFRYMYLHL